MVKLTANPARAAATITKGQAMHPTTTPPAPVVGAIMPAVAVVPAVAAGPNGAAHATGYGAGPSLLGAYVVCGINIATTGKGQSIGRKMGAYAVGRTVAQCKTMLGGKGAADIQWDVVQRTNVVVAAPNTPPALAALAILAGNGTPAHAATLAAYMPHLIAAQVAAQSTKQPPVAVAALPTA